MTFSGFQGHRDYLSDREAAPTPLGCPVLTNNIQAAGAGNVNTGSNYANFEQVTTKNIYHIYSNRSDSHGLEDIYSGNFEKIQAWVSEVDYFSHHQDVCEARIDHTGRWLLEREEVCTWMDAERSQLWIEGIPGAGKTCLASLIIEELRVRRSRDVVIFAYCRYLAECTALDILRSLVHQLLTNYRTTFLILKRQCQTYSAQKSSLSLSEITKLLRVALQQSGGGWIIIDGLDEILPNNEKVTLLKALNQLPASILVTLRPLELFVRYLSFAAVITVEAQDNDLETFIRDTIKADPTLHLTLERRYGAIEEVVQKIQANAQGMFLVAKLQLRALTGFVSHQSVMKAIQDLPSDLDANYSATLERIERLSEGERTLANMALVWVAQAHRPLHIQELVEALATSYEAGNWKMGDWAKDGVVEPELVLHLCGGLLVQDQSGVVRLIHFTAKSFLQGVQSRYRGLHAEILAMVCITHCLNPHTVDDSEKGRPFHAYAFENWIPHAEELLSSSASTYQTLSQLVTHLCWTLQLPHSFGDLIPPHRVDHANCLSEIAPCTITDYLEHVQLLQIVWYLHRPQELHAFPILLTVARQGQAPVLELLLRGNLRDPTLERHIWDTDLNGWLLLHHACWLGHRDVVTLLLAHQAQVDPSLSIDLPDMHGQTPLMLAATAGHFDILKELLLLDASIHLSSAEPGGASLDTIQVGYPVNVNVQAANGMFPLAIAASNGHCDIVRLLLADHRVDVSLRGGEGSSPLIGASIEGHLDVVFALLADTRVDVNVQRRDKICALFGASANGHVDVVRALLVDTHIDVNAHSYNGLSPLHVASINGDLGVMRALLSHTGVDVNRRSGQGSTPLIYASNEGHLDIVRALLAEKRVDMNARRDDGVCALVAASGNGHLGVVRALLEEPRLNINLEWERWTPLGVAAMNSHLDVLGLLLSHPRVKVNTPDSRGQSPLIIASRHVRLDALLYILSHPNVDVNWKRGDGASALIVASTLGHENIVQALLEDPRVEIDAQGTLQQTALISASVAGQPGVLKILLARGADPNARNRDGLTALMVLAQLLHEPLNGDSERSEGPQIRERYCECIEILLAYQGSV